MATVADALDGPEAGADEQALPDAGAEDEMTVKAPKGDDLGSKLDRILEMLEAKSRGGEGEHRLHDETDLDEMIDRLAGKEDGRALTIPAENGDACIPGPARDAAVELLRRVRPAVAAIGDKAERARVTDALLSAVRGNDMTQTIASAARDSAQANADKAKKTTYEQLCADSASAYAARNPHNRKEQ